MCLVVMGIPIVTLMRPFSQSQCAGRGRPRKRPQGSFTLRSSTYVHIWTFGPFGRIWRDMNCSWWTFLTTNERRAHQGHHHPSRDSARVRSWRTALARGRNPGRHVAGRSRAVEILDRPRPSRPRARICHLDGQAVRDHGQRHTYPLGASQRSATHRKPRCPDRVRRNERTTRWRKTATPIAPRQSPFLPTCRTGRPSPVSHFRPA